MVSHEWIIEIPVRRTVRLQHSKFSGRMALFIDGKLIFERTLSLFVRQFRHEFAVDGYVYYVSILPGVFSFAYSFGEVESSEPAAEPTRQNQQGKWLGVLALCLPVFVFLSVAIGTPLPIGNLRAPVPAQMRMFYALIAAINLYVMFRILQSANHTTSEQENRLSDEPEDDK